MQSRMLDERERLAIESILDDAEKCFTKGAISRNIEALDEQCKSIWADWEYSVHPARTSPEKSKIASPRIKAEGVSPRRIVLSSDDSSDSESIETEHHSVAFKEEDKVSESESDDICEEELLPRTAAKKKKPTFRAPRATAAPQPQRTAKKVPRKAAPIQSAAPVHPFNRGDAARLRQDNIELRSQVARLQAALDRANLENAKLKEEIQKMKLDKQKQKSMISYLKEERLYGRKK